MFNKCQLSQKGVIYRPLQYIHKYFPETVEASDYSDYIVCDIKIGIKTPGTESLKIVDINHII